MYQFFLKPLFDYLVAFFLLVLLSPFLILLILLLYFYNKGSVFFLQQRPGYQTTPFYIIKFKTMKDIFDVNGNPLPDSDRITPIGNFIRRYSLDELLQLVNVIKGEMSIVGPRPLLMQYLPRYNADQARRHEVRPGITGWAQVNGRNAISWEEKFNLDLYYVNNQSFFLDLLILWKTFIKVIARKDINANDNTTMPEFMGTDKTAF
ncbi:MAG: sugar transferase [Chitinophagaceae bacterium]|nr:sugar transferase [Chitinophagaceae bacterium]MCA6478081.1 sugar transferase [Chitinophagaceae bacterium]MCA6490285.1 sugar transferase [Chitinophagaceae bacterium]MCA6511664.1 sugar transferase [Chitinophagaceae bacterium]